MEHVKAWGVYWKRKNLWRLEKDGRRPLCALNKDDPELIREADISDEHEIAEIPDDYAALYSEISEAMIRRAKMLYWDQKLWLQSTRIKYYGCRAGEGHDP